MKKDFKKMKEGRRREDEEYQADNTWVKETSVEKEDRRKILRKEK